MLEDLSHTSRRTGKQYYGSAALIHQIFAKNNSEEGWDRETELAKVKKLIEELGYTHFDD
ncbi:MAG: hypothetical protein IJ716_14390 [Lachnospiraceae bacterium]|nr:hypothetical protein [Lachnospiraceae bacterium]